MCHPVCFAGVTPNAVQWIQFFLLFASYPPFEIKVMTYMLTSNLKAPVQRQMVYGVELLPGSSTLGFFRSRLPKNDSMNLKRLLNRLPPWYNMGHISSPSPEGGKLARCQSRSVGVRVSPLGWDLILVDLRFTPTGLKSRLCPCYILTHLTSTAFAAAAAIISKYQTIAMLYSCTNRYDV